MKKKRRETREPAQLIGSIRKDLEEWKKAINQYHRAALFQLTSLKKCKEVIRYKSGRFTLNPHRFGRLEPGEVPKEFRKEAYKTNRKVTQEFQNLINHKAVIGNIRSDVHRLTGVMLESLGQMDSLLREGPRWLNLLEEKVKLFHYERRQEIALFNKVAGKDLTRKPKKTRGPKQEGEVKMAKKKKNPKKVEQLLKSLAKSDDQEEKRQIRQELRSLGHKGGLGKGKGKAKAKVTKKTKRKAKKSKKAKKAKKS